MFSFFPMLSRMKYINRWGLMRNTRPENLCEHSLETAIIAHALVLIKNEKFGGNLNAEHAAVLAMFHDCSEIITGDLPTPIKYHNKSINQAYNDIENLANERLCSLLPDEFRPHYQKLFSFSDENDKKYLEIIKAADKISALIKCVEEKNCGNREFIKAEESTFAKLSEVELPEVKFFMKNIMPLYDLSLDEY